MWPSGSIWDCSPGALTRSDCEQACNTNSDCASYDGVSNVDYGECCLFMEGNTGNGNSRRTCFVKQPGMCVVKILQFKDSNSEYFTVCTLYKNWRRP